MLFKISLISEGYVLITLITLNNYICKYIYIKNMRTFLIIIIIICSIDKQELRFYPFNNGVDYKSPLDISFFSNQCLILQLILKI